MKNSIRTLAAVATAVVVSWAGSVSAQTLFTPSGTVSTGALGTQGIGIGADPALAPLDVVGNNILLRSTDPFNPTRKFIGIGESGGVTGPINGCDIYGFRAQQDTRAFINMGSRRQSVPGGVQFIGDGAPTISWGSQFSLGTIGGIPFTIRKNLDFLFDNSDSDCGDIVARMSAPANSFQFTVFGDALASGGMFMNSDARYKQNIQPIGDAMGLISQLQGTTYTMNLEAFPEMHFKEGTQYGLIAQEVQAVIPELVQANEDGYLAVNYTAMVPLLVEGLKEQQEVVATQKEALDAANITIEEQNQAILAQNEDLEAAKLANEELNNQVQEQQAVLEQQDQLIRQIMEDLEAIKNGTAPAANGTSAAAGETSQLFQNRPNPFRESTEIHFYLPTDVEQATLVVYSLDGKELMSFNNLDRGYGNVLVEAGQLMPGNYVYRLIADNEVVDSKTLVLSK